MTVRLLIPLLADYAVLAASPAQADTGKLLLTGGVSTIEGAAGGGLTPWAVIGSNATEGEVGASAYLTKVGTRDYGLNSYGAAVGIHDRYELSIAQQDLDTRGTGTAPIFTSAPPSCCWARACCSMARCAPATGKTCSSPGRRTRTFR